MAVVQISRIQIRRGQANGGTGLPQLASGEFAWALDTQELYIGNGAISEGAPYVGNTKLLTEHDNILELAALYEYKKNDESISTGANDFVQRSLQDRLDDIVSVRSFGAVGDGITDDTDAIQRAIDQLYINTATSGNPKSRVKLVFEAGNYILSDELRIPPYAHLIGDGIDSTIITQISNNVVMRMVSGGSVPGSYTSFGNMTYLQRPRFIHITGMSLINQYDRSIVFLDNTDSSMFNLVKFVGTYVNGTQPATTVVGSTTDYQSGILIRSNSSAFCTQKVLFQSCVFNTTGNGVYSDSESDTVMFKNCTFYQLYNAIELGGGASGALNSVISENYFDIIDRYGIYIKVGSNLTASYGNTSSFNKFYIVGNDNQSYANAKYPIILFETNGNTSTDDYFERNNKLKNQVDYGLNPFVPNVQTSSMIYDNRGYQADIIESGTVPIPLIRFPFLDSGTYEIDYVMNKFTSGTAIRTGVLHITVYKGNGITSGQPPASHIHDDFGYTGDISVEYIKFSVDIFSYMSTDDPDTMVISYINPISNGDATLNYTYRLLTK
jgi:hypothetical protein